MKKIDEITARLTGVPVLLDTNDFGPQILPKIHVVKDPNGYWLTWSYGRANASYGTRSVALNYARNQLTHVPFINLITHEQA